MFTAIKTPSKQDQPLFYMGCHFKCSKKCYNRKNLEASYIALWKPDLDLSEQKDFETLILFRNGVT